MMMAGLFIFWWISKRLGQNKEEQRIEKKKNRVEFQVEWMSEEATHSPSTPSPSSEATHLLCNLSRYHFPIDDAWM